MFTVFSKPVNSARLFELIAALLRTESSVPPVERVQHETSRARESLKILLAEDNSINQKVALRILAKRGYHADIVANGAEAIRAIERQRYDVVLLDVEMPEMDGLEATRRICARWPTESRPYLIAMTAHALAGDRELCLKAGMDDYIPKPIEAEVLFKALEQAARGAAKAPQAPVSSYQASRLVALVGRAQAPQMIDEFQGEVLKQLTQMQNARRRQDHTALLAAVQSMKTASLAFGAQRLVQLCTELEALVQGGELSSVDALLKGARSATLLSCAELGSFLKQVS